MTCPRCYAELTIDPACEISDPPHDGATRIAPAALCSACEYCVELTAQGLADALKSRCICGSSGPVCPECMIDMDAVADLLEKRS